MIATLHRTENLPWACSKQAVTAALETDEVKCSCQQDTCYAHQSVSVSHLQVVQQPLLQVQLVSTTKAQPHVQNTYVCCAHSSCTYLHALTSQLRRVHAG